MNWIERNGERLLVSKANRYQTFFDCRIYYWGYEIFWGCLCSCDYSICPYPVTCWGLKCCLRVSFNRPVMRHSAQNSLVGLRSTGGRFVSLRWRFHCAIWYDYAFSAYMRSWMEGTLGKVARQLLEHQDLEFRDKGYMYISWLFIHGQFFVSQNLICF